MRGSDPVPGVEPLSCPAVRDRDLVHRYLADELPDREAEAFVAHFFACDDCWDRLRAAVSLRADAGAPPLRPGEQEGELSAGDAAHGSEPGDGFVSAPGPRPTGVGLDRRLRRWAAAAVAAGVAAVAFDVWGGPAVEQPPRDGRTATGGAYRGAVGEMTVDVTRSAEGLAFSWAPVDETHHYLVRFYTADGGVAEEESVEEPGLEVAAGDLPGAGSLFVRVEARNAAGRVVARSSPVPVPSTEP